MLALETNVNLKIVTNHSAVIFNTSTGEVFIRGNGYLLEEFLKGIVHYKLFSLASEVRKESDHLIIKGSINSCNFAKGNMGNFLNKIVQNFIDTCSNVKILCPQPVGLYRMNCPFQVDQYIPIPVFSVIGKSFWEFYATVNVKMVSRKSMLYLGTTRIMGKIV